MTRWAFAFILAGVAVYLVAGQTQVGWLYLFDAIIWSLLALSAFLPGFSLKSLKVEQHAIMPAAGFREPALGGPLEDEDIEVRIKITNAGRLSRYFIKLTVICPLEAPETRRKHFFLTVLGRGATTFSYTAHCHRRGYYDSADVILESGGPLGLFVRRRKFKLALNLTVYPAFFPMVSLPTVGREWAEAGQGVKAGASSEFYGSRNYQYGDPLKHVHWRNTARSGNFMIKEFEQVGQGSIIIAIDNSLSLGDGKESTLEYAVKFAASLSRLYADSGRLIDMVTPDAYVHNVGWLPAMDFLARLELTGKTGVQPEALLPGGLAILMLPALVSARTDALVRLGAGGRGMAVLLEGFAPDERPEEVYSLLRRADYNVIHCGKGRLEETVKRLSSILSGTGGAVHG